MPTLLVHGHPETPAIWDRLRPHLRRETVALALPGYGSPRPAGFSATMDAYADWLVGELERVGGDVDLVGHDWGGGLTVRVACLRPDLLRSWASDALALFDPAYVWHGWAQRWVVPGLGEQIAESVLATPLDEVVERHRKWGVDAEGAALLQAGWTPEMWSCALDLYRSAPAIGTLWGADVERAAARPGLALRPAREPFLDGDCHARAARRAGARQVTLPGAGHWWLIEDPEAGARALEAFWASL